MTRHNKRFYAQSFFVVGSVAIFAGFNPQAITDSFESRDTYPKNVNVDVLNYAFTIGLSDESDAIHASTEVTVQILDENTRALRFDLISRTGEGTGMVVSGVSDGSQALSYRHENNELNVALATAPVPGNQSTIIINYSGIPASGLKIAPNKHGDRTFFSDNWPNRARHWLPTVDHPYDKATSEMIVTAPSRYQVVSNGLEIETTDLGNGMRTTHWKQSIPIATWLYVLGVAEFAVQEVGTFEGKSIQTWVYRQDREAGFYDFAVPTEHVMQFYTDYVGPYAYEKLANIQSNSVGGGMEAASAIFYGDNSVTGERDVRWRNVIIHEVAHQWFGNAVTEYDWNDVWLSEGFATYFTLLFREHAYGRDDFVEGLKQSRDRVYSFYQNNPDYRIVHENLDDMSQVTTGNTYQKGAWILHMLRNKVGDEAWWAGIRNYYRTYFNGNATTNDFRRSMEDAAGMDLAPFFQQWLYQGGHVVLDGSWRYDAVSKQVVIDISRTETDNYAFEFDVEFGFWAEGADVPEIHSTPMDSQSKIVSFSVETKPARITIDPRTVLLAEWEFTER